MAKTKAMNCKKAGLVLLASLLFLFANTQSLEQELAKQLEVLAEDHEVADYETESDFVYLHKHPLNINKATSDEWHVFPFINDILIKNLQEYRNLFGDLISIYELQSVPLWDRQILTRLLPFITVGNPVDLRAKTIFSGEHELRLRESRLLEKQKGFSAKQYKGSPDHLLLNYRYRYRRFLDAGITCEKDAGEPLFSKKYPVDFFSFHFFIRNNGLIRVLALGDFTVNLGQGLTHWQSLAFRKGSQVTNIKRQSPVIQPYTSSGEYNFHRGVAVTLVKRKTELNLFLSLQKQTAALRTDSLNDGFSNISSSGLHRTENEISQRNNLRYISSGGSLHYKNSFFSIGFNAITHIFSSAMVTNGKPYDNYGMEGKSFWNGSMDYSATPGRFHFFGEAAVDKDHSLAFVNGVLMAPARSLDLVVFTRNISSAFSSLNGNAFTENTMPSNEHGFYLGSTFRPVEGWQLDGYFDFFHFPWLKYRTDRPSGGNDYLLMLSCQVSKQWEFYSRFRARQKEINSAEPLITHQVITTHSRSWKIFFRTKMSRFTEVKGETDLTWYGEAGKPSEQGSMAYLETSVKGKWAISGNVRLTYFDTDGFNSRIYSYESSLPFSSEVPFLAGKGCRFYVNARVSVGAAASCAIRYSQSVFYDKSVIGMGLDEISGKKKSEVQIQFHCAF